MSSPEAMRERTRYFTGMLITHADFIRDQDYHRAARHNLNVTLHGSGVISGLSASRVLEADGPRYGAHITSGRALDPIGRLITVPQDLVVDLGHVDPNGDAPNSASSANWLSGAQTAQPPTDGQFLCVALRDVNDRKVAPAVAGSRPQFSVICERVVFRLIAMTELSSANNHWVKLARIVAAADGGFQIDTSVQDLIRRPDGARITDVIDAVVNDPGSSHELAIRRLDEVKEPIRRALRQLLTPTGLKQLEAICPYGDLRLLWAQHIKPFRENSWSAMLKDLLSRPISDGDVVRYESVHCVARRTEEQFLTSVRQWQPDIPEEVIVHAYRAATLVCALVRQWPGPRFDQLVE